MVCEHKKPSQNTGHFENKLSKMLDKMEHNQVYVWRNFVRECRVLLKQFIQFDSALPVNY